MTEKNIILSFEERLSKVKMPSGKRNTLLAAMKLFAAQGFHGTSTAQIAEVAGVSQATIFKYFKTKEELLIGVLEPMAELLSAPFIQNIMKFSKKEDIVHYFIYDRYAFIKANHSLVKIIIQELLTNSEMKHFIGKQMEQLAPSIDKIAERLCEGNCLRKTEVIRIAISPFFSYIMQMVTFDVESQDEEYDLTLLEQQTLKLLSE